MLAADRGPLDAADAVLALMGIEDPTKQQHVGALLVGGALIRLTKL